MQRGLKWRGRVWPLAAMAWLAVATTCLGEGEAAQNDPVKPMAGATNIRFQGLLLRVHGVQWTTDGMRLRIGFHNGTQLPIQAFGLLEPGAIWLEQDREGLPDRLPCMGVEHRIQSYLPAGGLAPGIGVVGMLDFAKPEEKGASWVLLVPGFQELRFDLDALAVLPAEDLVDDGRYELGVRVDSGQEALALVAMQVAAVVLEGERLVIELGFTNQSRHAMQVNEGGLNGAQLRLLTHEGELLEPVEVSPELARAIGPLEQPWSGRATHRGRVVFQRPHSIALHEVGLVFPGYPMVRWQVDQEGVGLVAEVIGGQAGQQVAEASGEQQLFDELARWVDELNGELNRQDAAALALRVEPGSEAELDFAVFLRGLAEVPTTQARWVLPARQSLRMSEDGVVRDVKLRFEHGLRTLAEGQRFATVWHCDLVPDAGGGWRLREIRYQGPPPFWVLGYTGFAQTDHFLLIYRPDTESADKIQASGQQVERAYLSLAQQALPLEERYVAFFVPFREDFQSFTGRGSGVYTGAASSMRVADEDGIEEFNRAMFINDHHYLVLQQALNLGDRQKTVTHELVHLALAQWTRPWTPPWLVEGIAVVHAGQLTPAAVRGLNQAGLLRRISLVSLMELGTVGGADDPRTVSAQYVFSGLATEILLRRYGREQVLGFYQAFAGLGQDRISREIESIRRDHPEADQREQLRRLRLRLTVDMLPRHFDGLTLVQLDQLTRFQVGR